MPGAAAETTVAIHNPPPLNRHMQPDEPPTLASRILRDLRTHNEPRTVKQLAEQHTPHTHANSSQTYKALRSLENAGLATRTRIGRGGQARDYWSATSCSR
jgi:DNA-binding PadR family transcriptional regulator